MADTPSQVWLTIIGIGEDGLEGLSLASREALERAELVMGAARHLSLLPALTCPTVKWPVPFADGVDLLMDQRGKRRVAMLVSGDPFWFGGGSSVTRHLGDEEWVAYPAPSTFSLVAARLGWAVQDSICMGLHAAPLERLRPHLAEGERIIALLRDGDAVRTLADYLIERGFGASRLHVMEAMGGARERVRETTAHSLDFDDIAHPVAVGIECFGGEAMPCASGLPDELFAHDGQITKRPVRALTLSALAPRAGETLWDIGAGSGSIGIEWLLAHPSNRAMAFEANEERAKRAQANALALGVDRLQLVRGKAPDVLRDHEAPDAVFIGGGVTEALLDYLWEVLPTGVRLVANAVTLESECLLAQWHARKGGNLLRVEMAEAAPLGSKRGWKSVYPIVQWSVTL